MPRTSFGQALQARNNNHKHIATALQVMRSYTRVPKALQKPIRSPELEAWFAKEASERMGSIPKGLPGQERQAALEMARRHLLQQLQRDNALENPDTTRNYLASRLRHYRHEVFACLFLDNRHRVIAFEELFRGTIDGASVHPREVVIRALHHNAAAVILAHNHPSGIAEPSRADIGLTRRLADALALVDIRVPDHLVIGDGQAVSFAERGLL